MKNGFAKGLRSLPEVGLGEGTEFPPLFQITITYKIKKARTRFRLLLTLKLDNDDLLSRPIDSMKPINTPTKLLFLNYLLWGLNQFFSDFPIPQ